MGQALAKEKVLFEIIIALDRPRETVLCLLSVQVERAAFCLKVRFEPAGPPSLP